MSGRRSVGPVGSATGYLHLGSGDPPSAVVDHRARKLVEATFLPSVLAPHSLRMTCWMGVTLDDRVLAERRNSFRPSRCQMLAAAARRPGATGVHAVRAPPTENSRPSHREGGIRWARFDRMIPAPRFGIADLAKVNRRSTRWRTKVPRPRPVTLNPGQRHLNRHSECHRQPGAPVPSRT